MSSGISREGLIRQLEVLELDWGDEEDAIALVDILVPAFDPQQVFTLLFFHCPWLDATPVHAIEKGRAREVFQMARGMVATRERAVA